jgi:phytoene synthase
MRPSLSPVAELVRRHDRDRYQTSLFAPARQRESLFALYAFNYEIARVRETVREPMLGRIRLQWWREVIEAAYDGKPTRKHVVAEPLTAAIREHGLTHGEFDRLIDARELDLEDTPPATLAALEDYADASSGALVVLALEVLGVRDKAVRQIGREIGIAYALTGLMRALPFHAAAGRSYIPTDVALRAGLDTEGPLPSEGSGPLRAAVREIAEAASQHLKIAKDSRPRVPRTAAAAMLAATIAGQGLLRLERANNDPFTPRLATPDPMQPWRLAMAALLNRL